MSTSNTHFLPKTNLINIRLSTSSTATTSPTTQPNPRPPNQPPNANLTSSTSPLLPPPAAAEAPPSPSPPLPHPAPRPPLATPPTQAPPALRPAPSPLLPTPPPPTAKTHTPAHSHKVAPCRPPKSSPHAPQSPTKHAKSQTRATPVAKWTPYPVRWLTLKFPLLPSRLLVQIPSSIQTPTPARRSTVMSTRTRRRSAPVHDLGVRVAPLRRPAWRARSRRAARTGVRVVAIGGVGIGQVGR